MFLPDCSIIYCVLYLDTTNDTFLREPNMASESVEEYIEAIYRLGGDESTVCTCDLAEQLSVSPPSVTTMLRRLSRDGLVTHTRYHGIRLTPQGRTMAISTLRRHRLSERLLTDVLGMSWDKVHEAACKLEHVIKGEIEEKTYEALGRPKTCPHGNPITCSEYRKDLTCLTQSHPGDRVGVVKVSDEQDDILKTAAQLGLMPAAELTVECITDEDIIINIDNCRRSLDIAVAEHIWVQMISESATSASS